MPKKQQRDTDRVRDMYERVDRDRQRNLQDNPDVLFRVYQDSRLHMVMFRSSDPGVWMSVIRSRIKTNLSLQLTKRRAVNDFFTISLSGSEEELKRFCEGFEQMYEKVMKNVQEDEVEQLRERITEQEEKVEQLRERIRELELENKKLRKK